MSKMSKAIAVLGVVAGLGVAALPLSSYAYDVSTSAKVTAEVEGAVSITTSVAETGGVVDLGKLTPNGDPKYGGLSVTVSSNSDGAAFDLNMTATDMTANNGADTIAKGKPAKGTSAWGYQKVENLADPITDFTGFAGITGTVNLGNNLTTSGAAEGTKATYTQNVMFAASAAPDQAAGNYSSTVTFTATVK